MSGNLWFESWAAIDVHVGVRITLALLHFLWLGCAVALVAALANRLLRGSSSQVRYLVNVTALLILAACLPTTIWLVPTPATDTASLSTRATFQETAPPVEELPAAEPPAPIRKSDGESPSPILGPTTGALSPDLVSSEPIVRSTPATGERASLSASLLERAAPFVVSAYLLGVVLMLGRLTLALCGGQRLARAAQAVQDAAVLAMVARQAQRLGLATTPAIGWCGRIAVPVVVGIARPMILLPASLATGLDASQLESLLAHELAHIRRFDLLVNLLQRLVEAVLFFHPATWYLSRQVSAERENACDDLVLAAGWPRLHYADALVRMAELCAGSGGATLAGHSGLLAASGESPTQFKRRVLRLLGHEPAPRLALHRSGIAILIAATSLLVIAPLLVSMLGDAASRESHSHAVETPDSARLPQRPKPTLGEWGPTVSGVQARLTLTEEPGEFRPGEVLALDLSIRNVTEKPVSIWLRNPLEWQWSSTGDTIKLHAGDRPVERGDWHTRFELKPGETRLVPRKKPRVLIQPNDWKGEPKDYNLPMLALAKGEYRVSATDVHVLLAKPDNGSEPLPLATGELPIKVIGRTDERPPVAARVTESLVRISWGETQQGVQAGLAWAADDELNNGDSCELFLRNVGEREFTLTYVAPPYDSWFMFGSDKSGKPYPPGKRFVEGFFPTGNATLKPGEMKRFATPHVLDRNSRPGAFPEDAGVVGREGDAGFPDAQGGYRFELKLKTGTLDLRGRPRPKPQASDEPRAETKPDEDKPVPEKGATLKERAIAWGEVSDGLQFGLSFPAETTRFRVGQVLAFGVHVRNPGEKPRDLRYGLPNIWSAEQVGERVEVFPMFLGGEMFQQRITLKPGEERELTNSAFPLAQQLLLAPSDWKADVEPSLILAPGTKARLVSRAALLVEPERETDWRGKAATGALNFEVLDSGGHLRELDKSAWDKPVTWPADAWKVAPLPMAWSKAEFWSRLTRHLLSRTERELKPYSFEERDGRITISYRTAEQRVWRPGGKAGGPKGGGPLVRRTEKGPLADGLLLTLTLQDEPGQAVRPQTLESDPWRTYLGEVALPELKTSLLINVSYGHQTDRKLLEQFVAPREWVAAVLAAAVAEKKDEAKKDEAKRDKVSEEEILTLLRRPGTVFKQDADGHVESISIGSNADDDWLTKIAPLSRLKSLSISSTSAVSPKGLAHLAKLSALESLDFYGVLLADEGLAHLAKLPRLVDFSASEAKLTDAALPHLARLTGLKTLRLRGNQITDDGLVHLATLTNLEVLDLAHGNWVDSRMRITDAGLPHLAGLTKLRDLHLGQLAVSDAGFDQLAGLGELRTLNLGGTQISGKGLRRLASFPKLESLVLAGPAIDDAGLAHVGNCGRLTYLGLSYTRAGDEGIRHLGRLTKLKQLSIDSAHITDAALAHLIPLTNLEHIELRATHVSDEGLKHLSRIGSLSRLDLSGSGEPGVSIGRNFTGVGYAHLSTMMKLKTLYLNNADVRWTELRDLKQLRELSMLMPTMSQADVRELQKALPDTFVSAAWGGSSVPPRQLFDEQGNYIGPKP